MTEFFARLNLGRKAISLISTMPVPLSDKNIGMETNQRAKDLNIIKQSRLFDEAYYLLNYPDIADSGIKAIEHFFDFGFTEDRKPNFYFQPFWYLNTYTDVKIAGLQPLLHYVLYGEAEGRPPSSFFDPVWYRRKYNIPKTENALGHYLQNAASCTVSPIPEFDAIFYGETYSDVSAANIDPFEHFINYGFQEGRNPSALFDTRFYANRYCSGSLDSNPFLHYLAHKNEPGIYGRLPPEEFTVARELKRSTKPGLEFEEFLPLPDTLARQVKLLAFYLPQFHTFKENDDWWGKGFTEWSNICRGSPRFAGHYQPRIPRDLGFYTLDRIEPMLRQIEMAKAGGIYGFVFYHYWFNDKRLMESPVERFLAAPEADMPFCLMWANESWTRRWDGTENDVLISQNYNPQNDVDMVAEFVRHFKDQRYIRVGGRPILMIYRPALIPNTAATIAHWRNIFQDQFVENPIIIMAQSFNDNDPTLYGMDGAVEFPPHKLTTYLKPANLEHELLDIEFDGKIINFDDVVRTSLEEVDPAYPLIRTVFPSWDNDARRQGHGIIITGSSPQKYENWLAKLIEKSAVNSFFGERIICINAWNEWCEGAYLEPDLHYGAAYLNATGRAVTHIANAEQAKLLLVGHDAFPSGAQHLLLNIGQTLKNYFALEIAFILLGPGRLENAYKNVAPTTIVTSQISLNAAVKLAAQRGFKHAIVNTTAAGPALQPLKAYGIAATTLVHELPRIIREKKLTDSALQLLAHSKQIVFPAYFVKEQFLEALGVPSDDRMVIIPQGVYKNIIHSPDEALQIRSELGLKPTDHLIIGVGYADMRKGFDLFLQLWRLLQGSDKKIHLAWAGDIDPVLNSWLSNEIAAACATKTFHMVGYLDNIDGFFSAADGFALTSREDPFPSVVLEALSMNIPCFVFEHAGGIPDMLRDINRGRVLPYCDVVAMASAIFDDVVKSKAARAFVPALQALIPGYNASFRDYASHLLSLAWPELPRVSVVVPNFNYAHHLPNRLASIFQQTHPVHEIIVLDDASTDESLTVIENIANSSEREIQIVLNKINSGSVFTQWRKAAELARGEFLWIAEADDLSDPGFLDQGLALLKTDKNIQFAFCDSRAIDNDGRQIFANYKAYYHTIAPNSLVQTEIFNAADFVNRYLSVKNLILNVSAVIWRRDALLQALYACEEELTTFHMAGDWLLYLMALKSPDARVAYQAKVLNTHRRHEKSITHSLSKKSHIAEISMCHSATRKNFQLNSEVLSLQKQYLEELRFQFGLSTPSGRKRRPINISPENSLNILPSENSIRRGSHVRPNL